MGGEAERRAQILAALQALQASSDPERAHAEADELLLVWISDNEVRAAFEAIKKWYA